ncbi:MAG: FtsB family cell division protein [Mycobacteriales bacterium]
MAHGSTRPGSSRGHVSTTRRGVRAHSRAGARPSGTPRGAGGPRAAVRPTDRRRTSTAAVRGGTVDSAGTRIRLAAAALANRFADSSRPARQITARAAVLGLVVCALVLSLAYPVRQYLAQRTQIASLRQDNGRKQEQVAELQRRKRQLTDPAYIRAQARNRLQYAAVGDTTYVVVSPPAAVKDARPTRKAPVPDTNSAWYAQLATSITHADQSR